MKPLSIQQVRTAIGGRSLGTLADGAASVVAVCTDTRRMLPSSVFFALRGPNHDGHHHLAEAASRGAIAAVVDTPPAGHFPGLHLILVPDARAALGKLASFVRGQMRGKVIGVAGSNGKTSTKHLIHAALSGKLRGSISPKSYNNDIGVPLSIFPADPVQDYLVLELGTNHPGEIARLSEMAEPDIGVITNIGAEHLEFLGDLMGVRRENASIIRGMRPRGLLVINGDDPELAGAVSGYPGKIITFGYKPENDLFATNIRCDEHGTRFTVNDGRREVFVPLLGRHTACNALAAIAVAQSRGLDPSIIDESLAEASGPEMRLQLQEIGDLALLNDAYNANPNSMRAALETLRDLHPRGGRRVAVLGDMKELGRSSERYHREIGQFVVNCGVDLLVCIGEQAFLLGDEAVARGFDAAKVRRADDSASACNLVVNELQPGDLVLLKASRSMELERVAQAVRLHAMARVEPRRKAAG
jgi:UDP-N-acetylmuramoyl-tripeptide--D-alanyl-D-alanine ligase